MKVFKSSINKCSRSTPNFVNSLSTLGKRRKIFVDSSLQRFQTEFALILLELLIIHRRVIKQIVQFLLVLVLLGRASSWSSPIAVKVCKMTSAAFNFSIARELEKEEFLEKSFTTGKKCLKVCLKALMFSTFELSCELKNKLSFKVI